MKIALVVPGGVDRSGEYRVIPALLALLKRLAVRHEVHVFALGQENSSGCWMLEGACIHNVGTVTGMGKAGVALRQARLISTILREHRLAPFDIVHSIWSASAGAVAVTAAKILRLPSIVHVAGGELSALSEIAYGGGLRWFGRVREKLVLRTATVVTAASAPMLKQLASMGRRARRVPLGVDLQVWPMRAPVRRDPQSIARLIHVASLNRVKDQTTLLHAAAMLLQQGEKFRLDVVGEDTLCGRMQHLARNLGLDGCAYFHGFMTQRQLRPLFEQAHINVVSSLHEAGPLVVLEAAVIGVPTVGTAVGHLVEWADTAALTVPCRDPLQLAASIRRLVDSEDLRLTLGGAALAKAVEEDADHTVGLFEKIYEELLGDGIAGE